MLYNSSQCTEVLSALHITTMKNHITEGHSAPEAPNDKCVSFSFLLHYLALCNSPLIIAGSHLAGSLNKG